MPGTPLTSKGLIVAQEVRQALVSVVLQHQELVCVNEGHEAVLVPVAADAPVVHPELGGLGLRGVVVEPGVPAAQCSISNSHKA